MKAIQLFLSFFCVLGMSCLANAGEFKDDSKLLEGTWKPVSGELSGKPLPKEAIQGVVLTMKPGIYEVTVDGNPDKGTFKLNANAKPRRIDITGGPGGPNAGRTIPAIYELSGNTLKVCYALKSTNAPTEFKTEPGQYLLVYQRAKSGTEAAN